MSHAVYQTQAVVLRSKNMRESNKILTLYTQSFGLIYATLQSVREGKSKMKYHTQLHSLIIVDLVRGRDIWRIVGVHEQYSSFSFLGTPWYSMIDRISSITLRLCKGEEPEPQLWRDYEQLHRYIHDQNRYHASIEQLYVIRILYVLGYWDGEESFLLEENPLRESILLSVEQEIQRLNYQINTSLQETQL